MAGDWLTTVAGLTNQERAMWELYRKYSTDELEAILGWPSAEVLKLVLSARDKLCAVLGVEKAQSFAPTPARAGDGPPEGRSADADPAQDWNRPDR